MSFSGIRALVLAGVLIGLVMATGSLCFPASSIRAAYGNSLQSPPEALVIT